ncbi:ABC transporter ATP-binding protein [uncultured Phascolarctobacterium sp.]|jgi:phospholipid/cholesterol/gamma-HCH transport system ATP-binding protein|uniref:ABC transporter ATP-binding protein n=1 Tax=uncultured Phascolarctobacterium sp. TaxID=512296 RepID=UPI0025DD9281|nr:ABC transporter ATP-binding protein [uncultured Phascolarctobacterium sp.]
MNEVMISLRQLTMAFGSKVVLDELDLDVYKGETLAVIGPSGSGKSTVIKVLTGLLAPTSGSVQIEGQETSGFDEDAWDELRCHMGVVFQYSALFDFLSVGENVAFGLRRHFKLPEEEIQRRVAALLEMVGMPGTQSMMPAELSGGMKKRVGLARALAMQPQVVFYDEPTSGLDPVMTMTISRLIRKTQQTLGVTSVLVTHDMESAYFAADRIAMLYKGKIVQVGTPDEIKRSRNPIVRAFVNGLELKEEDADEQQ